MSADIGIRTTLHTSFEDAIEKTTSALNTGGFGVLTTIDVKNTLKEKIDVDFRRYVILGACNPALAHRALSANSEVGLLLPCNVTVQKAGHDVVITAVNPLHMLGALLDDPLMRAVADEVKAKLERVISALK
jgi:uncharacterized protein (DUF302 family)